jgi:UDP-N-acetylmuramate dehydrogenase
MRKSTAGMGANAFKPAEGVLLAPMTTLGVGGPARYFAKATSCRELRLCVEWARERHLPILIIGGGSNLLVSDEGFPGLALKIEIRSLQIETQRGCVIARAGAGLDWDQFVKECVARGWAGIECLSGIPGSVGATPIQNVGAYGQEVSQTIVSVRALELETNNIVEFRANECQFGYRTSRFKARHKDRLAIIEVAYRLEPGGRPKIQYAELEQYLAERGCRAPGLDDVRRAVLAIRRRKAMVIDPSDPDSRSAGSFFINPVLTLAEFEDLQKRAQKLGFQHVPAFAAPDGLLKVPAAWLIERAGFERGYKRGGVGISTKHALAIVNLGSGTAREIFELARQIKSRVRDMFGIELQPEPTIVGFQEPL